MTKTIIKTALVTLIAIIVALGLMLGGFVLFNPKGLAEKCENLGLNRFSLMMYERNYAKNKDISSLYLMVDKSIVLDNDNLVIKYYPKLEEETRYAEYIEAVNTANYDESAKVLVNVSLSNADNRLKTAYVKALAASDYDTAFSYAYADLKVTEAVGYNINFCFIGLVNYIDETNATKFTEEIDGGTAVGYIASLYNALSSRYEAEKPTSTAYQKAVLSNKLIDIMQFMLLIQSKTDCGYNSEEINNNLQTLFSEYRTYIA